MKVLGIHYGHNATVCLIEDGKITFCQSEERLNRIKNSTGFPFKTLEYVYKNLAKPEEISGAVLFQKSIHGYLLLKRRNFEAFQYGYFIEEPYQGVGLKKRILQTNWGWALQQSRVNRKENDSTLVNEALSWFSKSLQLPKEKIFLLDHHASHAFSALPELQTWNKPSLVFVLDGAGDGACASVYHFEKGEMKLISRTDHRNSLGYYYSATTAIMGMRAGEHEFKVMGMAPYAKPKYYKSILDKLSKLLTIDSEGKFVSKPTPQKLVSDLTEIYKYQRFDNIAGAIQELTENLILEWIQFWVKKTGIKDIAVTGGVFMNVKASQRVAALPEIGKFYVVPSAADESCAIGSAVWGSKQLAPNIPIQPLKDLYLGVEYKDADIEKAIKAMNADQRYIISKPENVNREVGKLLASNHIVARCSGRMEWGARALGNRSILANASDFRNLQQINDAIKSRDFWMPFTPSVLDTDMPKYIQNHDRLFAPYMCVTFDSKPAARQDLAAAIHPRDLTVRPQHLLKEWNPDYYEVISVFKELTGIGGVLNTSFNLHGEPNVCSPEDAIRTVDNSGLNYLTMGSYLLKKKNSLEPNITG